ncbi:hypothetical protein AB1Y20_000666 [Prymnesium parvum]|uniref:Bet v1-like protein n=1 Tax=Prymnesium parvum TaxID=97485 RepID=A0AB34K6H7_PRYPA
MRSTTAFKLDIPAARYWKLSHNDSFRSYLAGLDGNILTTLSSTTQTDENGQAYVTRVTKISAKVNPVPIAIRKIGGLGEEFFFIMTESFWPERIGRAHKLTFSTEPPVLANRITVTGSHWVEPTGPSTCELCWELFVDVKMVGVGQTIARGVRDGSVEAQSKTAGRVISFLEQVGGCPDGNVRGQMSETHVARRRWHCALVTIMFMSRMKDDEEMIEEDSAVDSPFTAMKDPNRVLAYGKGISNSDIIQPILPK